MDKIADASRHAGFAAVIDHGGIVATPDRRELPSCDAGLLDRTFWKLRRATSRPNLVRIPLERKGEFREIEISSLFSNPGGGEKGRIERPRHVDSEFKRGRRVERRILGGVNFEMDSVSLVRHCREFNARLLGRRWTARPPRKREQHDRKNEARGRVPSFDFRASGMETETGRFQRARERTRGKARAHDDLRDEKYECLSDFLSSCRLDSTKLIF